MTTASNLYAEKVFAEHPIALWTFDDQADYVSLISEANRGFSTWTISGGTVETTVPAQELPSKAEPFPDSAISYVKNNTSSSTITITSPALFTHANTVSEITKFSAGFYVYYFKQNINSISIQHSVNGVAQGSPVIVKSLIPDSWNFISNIFSLGTNFSGTVRLIITITLNSGATQTYLSFNGLSAGQNSEEFMSESLGIETILPPSDIEINKTGLKAVQASIYGIQDLPAYYLIKDNKMLAQNTGIPMVYGSSNLTSISPNTSSEPSVVIPARGFLNESGKYRTYTSELWIRINAQTYTPKKIFGPITSSDGLYVDNSFLVFKVGDYSISHYVTEWYRPMLVHLSISKDSMSMMINGELIQKKTIDIDTVTLASYSYTGLDNNEYSGDWLGIYSYSDIPQIEIDCFAIYSYQVPVPVAKRRWVYGQAVDFPENTNTSYSGKSVYIDYPFANYTKNYLYPDIGRWQQGVAENVSTDKRYLSPNKYSLPSVVFKDPTNKSEENWNISLSDNASLNSGSIKLRDSSYLLFNKVNMLNQNMRTIYGAFRIEIGQTISSTGEILFKLLDSVTGNYLCASVFGSELEGYSLKYQLYIKNSDTLLDIYTDTLFIPVEPGDIEYSGSGTIFYAGLNFDIMSKYFGGQVSSFLGGKPRLKLLIGGSEDFSATFSGYIERFGFCTDRNFKKISSLFDLDRGIALQDNAVINSYLLDGGGISDFEPITEPDVSPENRDPQPLFDISLFDHIASYTLYPKMFYGDFLIDIATDSYWEDYIPLSYLGKEVLNDQDELVFDIDLIQFNIDYPKPLISPDPIPLVAPAPVKQFANRKQEMVKTYISFQDISTKNITTNKFEFKKNFTEEETVRITSENQIVSPSGIEWQTKRYEVVNDTIILPPTGVNLKNLGIVIHIEMTVDGINTRPIKIKRLQLASKSLNYSQPNEIGTRFGNTLYGYKEIDESTTSYKDYSTYVISKTTKPYLYLTRNSGIQPIGDLSDGTSGISIPINQEQDLDFALSAIQFAARLDSFNDDTTTRKFLDIKCGTGTPITLSIKSIDSGRFQIISDSEDVDIFINGKYSKTPVISSNIWNMITIGFVNSISSLGNEGSINITWPLTINNFSYFQETSLQKIIAGTNRQWFSIKYGIDPNDTDGLLEWADWKNLNSCDITNVEVTSSYIKYNITSTAEDLVFVIGNLATVSGFSTSGLNILNEEITDSSITYFQVANTAGVTAGTYTASGSETAYCYTWLDLLVNTSSKYVGVSASDLYKSYTGTNKIIGESSQSLDPTGFKYSIYQNLSTVTKTVTPL